MLEYLIMILCAELMIYLALRIIWAFAFFIEPQSEPNVMSVEEFQQMMEGIFDKDDKND